MAPKKAPKRFKNIGKKLAAEKLGKETPKTDAELARELLAESRRFIELSDKIPKIEPESFRRLAWLGDRFRRWVADCQPELLHETASWEHMPQLFMEWLYFLVRTSHLRTRPNSVTRLDDQGNVRAKLYMAGSTLHSYRFAVVQLLGYFVTPHPGRDKIQEAINRINRVCANMVMYFDLARPSVIPNVLYAEEIRVLLESVLGIDLTGTNANDLQFCLMILIHLFTGCRTMSLLSGDGARDNFLVWRDIILSPHRKDDDHTIIGIKLRLTLRHFKGYSYRAKLILRFHVGGTQKRVNLIFDLPCFLFAHAFRCGIIEGPDTLEELLSADHFKEDSYRIKEEFLNQPVFFRYGHKGTELDFTGPLTTGGNSEVVRRHLTQAGLRLPSDPTVSLYCIRKGFITRNYMNPKFGPVLTRQAAGHSPRSWTIEADYLEELQMLDFTQHAGLGEAGDGGPDRLYLQRKEGFKRKTTLELAELDAEFAELKFQEIVLRKALEMGSDRWKREPPFVDYDHKWDNLSLDDTLEMWEAIKSDCESRLSQLRRKEIAGELDSFAHCPPNYVTRAKRIQENLAESPFTKDLEKQILGKSLKGIKRNAPANGATIDREFNESALDSDEIDENEPTYEDGSELAVPGIVKECLPKFCLIKRLTTERTTAVTCGSCQEDDTCSEEDKAKLWQPSLLEKHLGGYLGKAQSVRLFHSPQRRLERWLVLKGMSRLESLKKRSHFVCNLPKASDAVGAGEEQELGMAQSEDGHHRHGATSTEQAGSSSGSRELRATENCGFTIEPETSMNVKIFNHLHSSHLAELPLDLRTWLEKWRAKYKDKNANRKPKSAPVEPKHLRVSHQAPPSLPAEYIVQSTDQNRAYHKTNHLLRELYAGQHLEAKLDYDNPEMPVLSRRGHTIMEALEKRLGELEKYIPTGLYKEDGETLNVDLTEGKDRIRKLGDMIGFDRAALESMAVQFGDIALGSSDEE